MKQIFILLALVGWCFAASPVVSDVVVVSVECDSLSVPDIYKWKVEATFTLTDADNDSCRIWPGLRVLEKQRILKDEGPYLNYTVISGDTNMRPGHGRIKFEVSDTCGYDSVRVKVTAWDRKGWAPLPNRNFFQRHHALGLDVRGAKLHASSMNILHYMNSKSSPKTGTNGNFHFISVVHGDKAYPNGAGGMGIFRVSGDHPRVALDSCNGNCDPAVDTIPLPIPKVSLGDISEPLQGAKDCYATFVNTGFWSGDCHLGIVDVDAWKAYEVYHFGTLADDRRFAGGPPAIYNLNSKNIPCVSSPYVTPFKTITRSYKYRASEKAANVSGISFSAWALKVDEVLDGEVQHAIGFNWWFPSNRYYVYPTHKKGGEKDGDTSTYGIPMGLRLRLKPSYDIVNNGAVRSLGKDSTTARILLRALQKYGTFMAQVAGSNHAFHMLTEELPDKPFSKAVSPNFNTILTYLGLDLERDFEVVDWDWEIQQYLKYPQDGPVEPCQ